MPIVASTTAQDFWEWVREQGYSGSPNDQLSAFLTAEGYSIGSMNNRLNAWLVANGYAGNTLNERLDAFERTNTIQH